MKWIEVITVRSLVKANKQMVDELLRQVFKQKESGLAASIRVYHRPTVETDLSIHIHWENGAQHPSESPLGQQLSYALKALGLLHHSIWVEAAAMECDQNAITRPFPDHGYSKAESKAKR